MTHPIRKRVREEDDADSVIEKAPHFADNGWPYWPAEHATSGSWPPTQAYLRWQEYPFLPRLVPCAGIVQYTDNIPTDLTTVQSYTRGDFWNLLPWVGPPVMWGKGYGFGIDVMHDPPPFYHECTLARDFVTQWPPGDADTSVVGTCPTLIPILCAYCWAHSWRRCDTVPRVGAYSGIEAHMSPVLDYCDSCGLTSDYNIARLIVLNRFDHVFALVDKGRASVLDVFRALIGVNRWSTPGDGDSFKTIHSADLLPTYGTLVAKVRVALQEALVSNAPALASISDVTSIILMYCQGIHMTAEDPRDLTGLHPAFILDVQSCTHSFPCLPGKSCVWAHNWTYTWAKEVAASNINLSYKFRTHAEEWFPGVNNWQPNNWAEWGIIRVHRCNMMDSDADEGDEGGDDDEDAIEMMMDRDRERGLVIDWSDEPERDEGGYDVNEPPDDDNEGDEGDDDVKEPPNDANGDVGGGDANEGDDGNNLLDAEADANDNEAAELEEDENELKLYRDGWE